MIGFYELCMCTLNSFYKGSYYCEYIITCILDSVVVCVAMMRERLADRAAKTLLGLGRHLTKSSNINGVTSLQLQLALRQFHISITPEVNICVVCVQCVHKYVLVCAS